MTTFTAGQKVRASDLNNMFHRVGSVVDTTNAATVTTEVVKGTVTVSLVNGRRYRISLFACMNIAGTSVGTTAGITTVRYASGSTVTTAGTAAFNLEWPITTNGFNSTLMGFTEIVWSAGSGTYTFGICPQRATGSAVTLYGGGTGQPALLTIDDMG